MAVAPFKFRRPMPKMTRDPARSNRNTAPFSPREFALGTVGYSDSQTALPEGTPAWIRWEQGEALVEVTLEEGDRVVARLGLQGNCSLTEGQQVALVFPGGEPNAAIIVGVLHSSLEPAPSSVGGVSTGAGSATDKGQRVAAATWEFTRLSNGRMLAIQTNDQDINIWAGAGMHLKAGTGALHLDGTTHLGAGPVSGPIGSRAAPGGEEIPGVPAAPFVPEPYTAPPPPGPETAPVPYVGLESGIVRASDIYQVTPQSDPGFFVYLGGLAAAAGFPDPLPLAINVRISGVAGPGSEHTANGDVG